MTTRLKPVLRRALLAAAPLLALACGPQPQDGQPGPEPGDTDTATSTDSDTVTDTGEAIEPPECPEISAEPCDGAPDWYAPELLYLLAEIAGGDATFELATSSEDMEALGDPGHLLGAIGGRTGADGNEQFFLVGVEGWSWLDLTELTHSVTPLPGADSHQFVDLVYDSELHCWLATVCEGDSCYVARSDATFEVQGGFTPLPGGALPAGLSPVAMDAVGEAIYVAGDGLARLVDEEWQVLVEPGSGALLNEIATDTWFGDDPLVVAVGDSGRLVVVVDGEVDEQPSETDADLLDVAILYYSRTAGQTEYVLWAVGSVGTLLIANTEGSVACPIADEDIVHVDYYLDINWEGAECYNALVTSSGRVFYWDAVADLICELPPGPAATCGFEFFNCVDAPNPSFVTPDGIWGRESAECVYTD
jgi:hypothetical protein